MKWGFAVVEIGLSSGTVWRKGSHEIRSSEVRDEESACKRSVFEDYVDCVYATNINLSTEFRSFQLQNQVDDPYVMRAHM